jgi:hypothetical protein
MRVQRPRAPTHIAWNAARSRSGGCARCASFPPATLRRPFGARGCGGGLCRAKRLESAALGAAFFRRRGHPGSEPKNEKFAGCLISKELRASGVRALIFEEVTECRLTASSRFRKTRSRAESGLRSHHGTSQQPDECLQRVPERGLTSPLPPRLDRRSP